MTGFDETVPPDPDPDTDATSAEDVGDNVLPATDGPGDEDNDSEDDAGGEGR